MSSPNDHGNPRHWVIDPKFFCHLLLSRHYSPFPGSRGRPSLRNRVDPTAFSLLYWISTVLEYLRWEEYRWMYFYPLRSISDPLRRVCWRVRFFRKFISSICLLIFPKSPEWFLPLSRTRSRWWKENIFGDVIALLVTDGDKSLRDKK